MALIFSKKLTAIAISLISIVDVAFCAEDSWCSHFMNDDIYKYCESLSFYGSWLYWKASGDEYDFAVHKIRNEIQSPAIVRDTETIHDIRFDWDSGFRLGINIDFPCPFWDLDINWTHYNSSSSKSKEFDGTIAPVVTTLVSMPVVYDFGTELDPMQTVDIKGRLSLRYNTIDFEFGKWWTCHCRAQIRPHAGVRIADIRENFHDKIIFKRNALESFSGTDAVNAGFFRRNRFKGAGIRAGLDVDLSVCQGWDIIGRSAASLIWGKTRLNHQFSYNTPTVLDFYESEIKESYRVSRVITDLLLGIRYTGCACDSYPFTFEIAWEHHMLFGQHRYWVDNSFFTSEPGANPPLLTTSSWKKRGNLALQGLTITAGIEF